MKNQDLVLLKVLFSSQEWLPAEMFMFLDFFPNQGQNNIQKYNFFVISIPWPAVTKDCISPTTLGVLPLFPLSHLLSGTIPQGLCCAHTIMAWDSDYLQYPKVICKLVTSLLLQKRHFNQQSMKREMSHQETTGKRLKRSIMLLDAVSNGITVES